MAVESSGRGRCLRERDAHKVGQNSSSLRVETRGRRQKGITRSKELASNFAIQRKYIIKAVAARSVADVFHAYLRNSRVLAPAIFRPSQVFSGQVAHFSHDHVLSLLTNSRWLNSGFPLRRMVWNLHTIFFRPANHPRAALRTRCVEKYTICCRRVPDRYTRLRW